MKKTILTMFLPILLVVNTACGTPTALVNVVYPDKITNDQKGWQAYRKQNEVSENFTSALSSFTSTATESVLSPDKSGNANFSPLSLYYALAISQSGANGETADEIYKLIARDSSITPEEISEQCGKLFPPLIQHRRIYIPDDCEFNLVAGANKR